MKRGRGVAAINYPTGMNLGGDPSQAIVHATPTGDFMVSMSSVDLGQGLKTIMAQLAAETLGVPTDRVWVDTADTDTGPHCTGTFASRGTHRAGNAVIVAAREARQILLEVAAEKLEVNAEDLVTDGAGQIHVVGAPAKAISIREAAGAAQFEYGRTVTGRGIFLIDRSFPDPETGKMKPATCYAHACTVADVEVDDETGDVKVLFVTNVFEIGRALNPAMVEQQLVGGNWMGIAHALYETTEPYYPQRTHLPQDFTDYPLPGPGDVTPARFIILERPAADGPYGGKGPGEMCANPQIPAIANAIHDAVGVRIEQMPMTPERVLRAIRAKQAAERSAVQDNRSPS